MTAQRVLVTGGSGFIAGHIIVQLIEQGHEVRTTVRSLTKEPAVRSVLETAGMIDGDRLTFVAADLTSDRGWGDAVADMDVVLHVASPVQPGHVDDEDDLIAPARDGALRVLRAARDGGVGRVVLTSAFHAVAWGHPDGDHVFTEDDWTVVDGPGVDAYGKSKTLAERAAWDFISTDGAPLELTTMLPVAVMGPVMGSDISGANRIIKMLLDGAVTEFPRLFIPIVDVRDVAAAHIVAMSSPDAIGQRFLLSNGPALALEEIGATLRSALGAAADRVPTRSAPTPAGTDLDHPRKTSNDKARTVLGWTPRNPHDAIIGAANSMLHRGMINN